MSKDIKNLESNIIKAADSLTSASCSLRSCYCVQDSSNEDFKKLRSDVTNYAKVYEKKVLPFANVVVRRVKSFLDNYRVLSYEEFVDDIHNIAKEVNNYVDVCNYTLGLHKAIITDFKNAQNSAIKITNKMNLDSEALERRRKWFKDVSNADFGWAIALCFVPVVNLIATPLLISKGIEMNEQAVATAKQANLTEQAIQVIEITLVPSIDGFIKALTKICGFFENVASELTTLAENAQELAENDLETARKRHHKIIKKNADEIVEACRYYIAQIPVYETNLRAIPNKHDKNYVQEWLSTKRVSTENNNNIPLAVWGRKLFASNEKLINLINN